VGGNSSTLISKLCYLLFLLFRPFVFAHFISLYVSYSHRGSTAAWEIMKPPLSLPLEMAERLLRAQRDLVANHVIARSISDYDVL